MHRIVTTRVLTDKHYLLHLEGVFYKVMCILIVSTGLAFATPLPPRIGRFCRFSSLGVSFSGTEISIILKNMMAAVGISLKIIYIFLLAVSHR